MGDWSDNLDPPDLGGLEFVFSGQMQAVTRAEAIAAVRGWGGKVSGLISASTTHLVVGDGVLSKSKLLAAQAVSADLLDEVAFLALIKLPGT